MLFITILAVGAAIGLIISTTGVGGGVIVLPILTYFFGMNALMAVATANLLSMLMKVTSSYMHFRLGNIPMNGRNGWGSISINREWWLLLRSTAVSLAWTAQWRSYSNCKTR